MYVMEFMGNMTMQSRIYDMIHPEIISLTEFVIKLIIMAADHLLLVLHLSNYGIFVMRKSLKIGVIVGLRQNTELRGKLSIGS